MKKMWTEKRLKTEKWEAKKAVLEKGEETENPVSRDLIGANER